MRADTISLAALLAVLSERVHDAGGYVPFAAKHGLTPGHWGNIAHGRRPPNAKALAALGYEAVPVVLRFRKVTKER